MSGTALERLADNTLLLVQELRNNAKREERIAEQLHHATEAMLATKREVSDSNATHETVLREVRDELGKIREKLAVVSADVDDAERAAGDAAREAKATREATGAHKLAAAHEGNAGLLRAFGELPPRSQTLIVIALLALPGAGAVGHWLYSLFSK